MVTSSEAVQFLAGRTKFGIKLGLENISKLLESVLNPHFNYPVIHIAGTNGKGSTSSFVASVLQEHGLKVGLYTSPHLVYLNERIRINGIPVTNEEFCTNLEEIKNLSETLGCTFFDVMTAIAFLYFSRQKVDVAVIEVGMGGRFDSTNVVNPEITVITSIGFDHQKYLGETLAKIAFEKAGIIKNNIPVFLGDIPLEAFKVIKKEADEKNSKLFLNDSKSESYLERNSTLAVKIVSQYLRQFTIVPNEAKMISGINKMIQNTGLWGRFHEIKTQNQVLILDAAHNPDGIDAMIKMFRKRFGLVRPVLVFGCVADKEYEQMLEKLLNLTSEIHLVLPELNRGNSLENLRNTSIRLDFSVETFPNSEAVMKFILNLETDRPVIICGSLYLLGEIYGQLIEKNIIGNFFKGLTINQ